MLLVLLSISLHAQKFEFESYGLKNDHSRGQVIYAPAKLIVENLGESKYSIIAHNPSDGSVSMNADVTAEWTP